VDFIQVFTYQIMQEFAWAHWLRRFQAQPVAFDRGGYSTEFGFEF
jgi:hypothetical protein